MKNDSRGFTLIELIVSFAILGIVVAVVGGLLTAGANSYRIVSTDLNLQFESQIAMSQMQSYVIDTNTAVYAQNNELFVVKDESGAHDGSGVYVYRFQKPASDNKLYLSKSEQFTENESGGTFDCSFPENNLMSNYVDNMPVSVQTAPDGRTSVIITLVFSSNGKSYTGRQTIALRNSVYTNQSASDFEDFLARYYAKLHTT